MTSDRMSFASIISVAAIVAVAPGGCNRSGSESARAPLSSQPAHASQMLRVPSTDGTLIAVECAGAGPTLIMVHGGVGDRSRWTPMFPLLSSHFTVCAMDRRGHGLSGDSADYGLQKEAEDVASVVDSRSGTVFVLGHSYGGVAALEAMFLTNRVSKLILYEPPLEEPADHNLVLAQKMERMIKEGAREQAAVAFMTEAVQLSSAEVTAMMSRPAWPGLVSTIEAQVRQMHALSAYRFDPTRLHTVTQPTLLLIGSDTASPYLKLAIGTLQASLPHATRVVLEGQQHNAMDTGRDVLAEAITTFLVGTTNHGTPK